MVSNAKQYPLRAANVISAVCRAIVLFFGAAACVLIISAVFSKEAESATLRTAAQTLIVIAGLVLACFAIMRLPLSENLLLGAVLLLGLALRIAYIIFIDTRPESDFQLLYNSAVSAAGGDFSWADTRSGYYYMWAYQIPFVLYEAAVLSLFNTIWALKIMNIVFMTGTLVLVYYLAKMVSSRRAAICALLLYSVSPDVLHLTPVLTNQHIAVFFLLLGLYILMKKPCVRSAIATGLLLGISDLMRPEATLAVIAVFCGGAWMLLQEPSKERLMLSGKVLLSLLLSYFVLTKGAELLFIAAGWAPNGLGNNLPEWKFILGLDPDSGGAYSSRYEYLMFVQDAQQRSAQAADIISSELASIKDPFGFFFDKLKLLWAQDSVIFWAMPNVDMSTFFARAAHLLTVAVSLVMWALCLAGVTGLKDDSGKANRARLLAIMLIGIFLVFMLIEVQARYRYIALPFAAVLAACGIQRMQKTKQPTEGGTI